MDSDAYIKLALNILSCSQKELAIKLGVSPTQITKWKKGEHMSLDMEDKLRKIMKIGDKDPRFILWAGGLEEASKWEKLISYLADRAHDNEETGYDTEPLLDPYGSLCWHTFYTLIEMGVIIPKKFPKELEFDYYSESTDDEALWDNISENPYSNVIYNMFLSLNDVYGFYIAYIANLMFNDDLNLYDTPAENIDSHLIALAACKIDISETFAPKFKKFKYDVLKDYREWLTIVKEKALSAGIPLKAELLDMVYSSSDDLGHEAEAESLGFNESRIHPDIYMNELLVGIRAIHQVLPAIMKKLGIYDEFVLDESELKIKL